MYLRLRKVTKSRPRIIQQCLETPTVMFRLSDHEAMDLYSGEISVPSARKLIDPIVSGLTPKIALEICY